MLESSASAEFPSPLGLRAQKAFENSHAPYSRFRVGAALECQDGTIFDGCNVENASFGLTMCAERTAVFTAVAAGHQEFSRIAIAADHEDVPIPCGACLQVLSEWGNDMEIRLISNHEEVKTTLYQLLPLRFDPKTLPGIDS